MRLTADTNVLVRAIVEDDARQAAIARKALLSAELLALTLPVLCELAWVLSRAYHMSNVEIAAAIRRLQAAANVEMEFPAVESGLTILDAGGDFADGVIAHQGRRLGAETFVSFDRTAVRLLQAHGEPAQLLA